MTRSDADIAAHKKELRRKIASLRNALTTDERNQASEALGKIDPAPLGIQAGWIVAGYHPIRSELDCLCLLDSALKLGTRTALPVTLGDEEPLLFREWQTGAPLEDGLFGIRTPMADAAEVLPDLLFMPLLAFDKRGHRLGYGKGHYDRTIAKLTENNTVIKVGVAYDVQEIDEVPNDAFDQPLDWIITPSGLRKSGD